MQHFLIQNVDSCEAMALIKAETFQQAQNLQVMYGYVGNEYNLAKITATIRSRIRSSWDFGYVNRTALGSIISRVRPPARAKAVIRQEPALKIKLMKEQRRLNRLIKMVIVAEDARRQIGHGHHL